MPSIYNHDHCWGVKRSCYSYLVNDYNEDLQDRKLTNGVSPNSNTVIPETNPVQYSVSANGYYGYQPHINDTSTVNHPMDIEENVDVGENAPVSLGNSNISNYDDLSFNSHQTRRKRHFQEDYIDNFKRMRQEDSMATEQVPPPVQESHQFGGGSRMKHRRWPNCLDLHDFSSENVTQLLRHTHGCEYYLYERNCDY